MRKTIFFKLDRELNAASRASKLQDGVAFRNARQRFESDGDVPADDSDAPPGGLQAIRTDWRAHSARLAAERRPHAQSVFNQYDQTLATNQAALTQSQRLDDALQVQQRRDSLKWEWSMNPQVPPSRATKARPLVNSLGMKFVPIPGTKVLMCVHETRRKDYAAFASDSPNVDEAWKHPVDVLTREPLAQGDDHPAIQVSWEDATAFCDWLSRREHRTYRLPGEREWNLAAAYEVNDPSGISEAELANKLAHQYPWGTSDGNDGIKYGNYDGSADGYGGTSPVMSFLPNRLGLFDLGGNASEWCGRRVLNGCGYRNHGPFRTSATHLGCPPNFRAVDGDDALRRVPGFRCVLEVVQESAFPATSSLAALNPAASVPTQTPPAKPVGGTAPRNSPTPQAFASPTAATPRPVKATPARAGAGLAKATKEAPFVNSLGMKFVPVPGAKVLFCMHETRNKDYAAYVGETPELARDWRRRSDSLAALARAEEHPLVMVSYERARAFCTWLSAKEGLAYRMPTDKEWSYAVGIGHKERWSGDTTPEMRSKTAVPNEWPWGNRWPPPPGAGNFGQGAIGGYTDGYPTTAPVMSFTPNKLGIFDLSGNVGEMCEDWLNSIQNERVVRGEDWSGGERNHLWSSFRGKNLPTNQNDRMGFRCVVEVPEP